MLNAFFFSAVQFSFLSKLIYVIMFGARLLWYVAKDIFTAGCWLMGCFNYWRLSYRLNFGARWAVELVAMRFHLATQIGPIKTLFFVASANPLEWKLIAGKLQSKWLRVARSLPVYSLFKSKTFN